MAYNIYSVNSLSGSSQSEPQALNTTFGTIYETDESAAQGNLSKRKMSPTAEQEQQQQKNRQYATAGMNMAAAGLQQGLYDKENPAMQYGTQYGGTIAGTHAYDKSEVVTGGNTFDDAYANIAYSAGENQYDYGAGEGAKVLGTSIADGYQAGSKGGFWGGVGGAIGGAFSGLFKNIISKRKAKEWEELAQQEEAKYMNQQRNYFDDQRDISMDIARQQELARRSTPNYTTSIYNV